MQIFLLGSTFIGFAFIFVGCLVAVITTFGIDKRWGFASLVIPFLPLVFCVLRWREATYPLRLLGVGIVLSLLALGIGTFASCPPDRLYECSKA